MNKSRRSNIKDKVLDTRHLDLQSSSGSSKMHKRLPSAGGKDFKISRNHSPNNSDIRHKRAPDQHNVIAGSTSMQSHILRNRYEDKSYADTGNRTLPHAGSFINQTPVSSIQKKIKDMLASGKMIHGLNLNRSGVATQKTSISNSKLQNSLKTPKVLSRKTPSAKIDLNTKALPSREISMGLPPKPRENEGRARLFDHQSLIDGSINSALKRDNSRKKIESDIQKTNFNSTTLYQKFSQKIHSNKTSTARSGFKENGFIRQKSNTLVGAEHNQIDADISLQPSRIATKKNVSHTIHRRSESETLKKSIVVPKSHTPSRVQSGKKRPPSQPNSELIVREGDKSRQNDKAAISQIHHQMQRSHSNKEPKGQAAKLNNINPTITRKSKNFLNTIRTHEHLLPPFEPAKVIIKDFGKIKAFSVNTHQGIFRSYNEDRVSILLNAQQR